MFIIKISVHYIFWQNHFKSHFNVFIISDIFNKSSAVNYFLTRRLKNQSWIKSICNYRIAKVENSIQSKYGQLIVFQFYHWHLRHQENQLICYDFWNEFFIIFFKNHTKFYFVRLTFRLAALDSRTSCAEFHPSVSYTVG